MKPMIIKAGMVIVKVTKNAPVKCQLKFRLGERVDTDWCYHHGCTGIR